MGPSLNQPVLRQQGRKEFTWHIVFCCFSLSLSRTLALLHRVTCKLDRTCLAVVYMYIGTCFSTGLILENFQSLSCQKEANWFGSPDGGFITVHFPVNGLFLALNLTLVLAMCEFKIVKPSVLLMAIAFCFDLQVNLRSCLCVCLNLTVNFRIIGYCLSCELYRALHFLCN